MEISKKSRILFISFIIIISVACARESYNITYNGVIVDEESNYPIPYSNIQSFCLFQQNIDQSSTYTATTSTDSLGNFNLSFDKGYKITMIIEANDYVERYMQFKPQTNHMPDTIYLKRKVVLQSSTAKPQVNLP